MQAGRMVSGLILIAALSACASTAPAPARAPLGTALNEAEAALKAGQNDKAVVILEGAARNYPTEKMPWLRLAQLRYETNNYGEAIVAALEALERDADDTLAHSIVAVSGLRVASKALTDLTQKNNLTGNIKTEAQDLTRLLRTALGEENLVPVRPKAQVSTARRAAPVSVTPPAAKAPASSDPFGTLK